HLIFRFLIIWHRLCSVPEKYCFYDSKLSSNSLQKPSQEQGVCRFEHHRPGARRGHCAYNRRFHFGRAKGRRLSKRSLQHLPLPLETILGRWEEQEGRT